MLLCPMQPLPLLSQLLGLTKQKFIIKVFIFFTTKSDKSTHEVTYHTNTRITWFATKILVTSDKFLNIHTISFPWTNWKISLPFSFWNMLYLMGKPKYLLMLHVANQTTPLSSPHNQSFGFLNAHMGQDLCQLSFPPYVNNLKCLFLTIWRAFQKQCHGICKHLISNLPTIWKNQSFYSICKI